MDTYAAYLFVTGWTNRRGQLRFGGHWLNTNRRLQRVTAQFYLKTVSSAGEIVVSKQLLVQLRDADSTETNGVRFLIRGGVIRHISDGHLKVEVFDGLKERTQLNLLAADMVARSPMPTHNAELTGTLLAGHLVASSIRPLGVLHSETWTRDEILEYRVRSKRAAHRSKRRWVDNEARRKEKRMQAKATPPNGATDVAPAPAARQPKVYSLSLSFFGRSVVLSIEGRSQRGDKGAG